MKKTFLTKVFSMLTVSILCVVSTLNAQTWDRVELSELQPDDVFMIVDVNTNGTVYAMSNSNGTGSAPAAVTIQLTSDSLHVAGEVADNLKWNVSGNASDGYIFYPNGDSEKWLYCTSTNNGVRIGTNANKTFILDGNWLKNIATSRWIGVYVPTNANSPDWRCYTNTTGNIKGSRVKFFRFTEEPTAIATPVFSVTSGTYYEPQTITISCETPDVAILYTTDGTTPHAGATVYTSPLTFSTTTTLKAVACNTTDTSHLASATYTIPTITDVADVATLRAQTADAISLYRLTGSTFITHTANWRHHKYVQDATAGILIDDNAGIITTSYAVGDEVANVIGTLTNYNGLLEFAPVADPGAALSTNNTITPLEITLDEVSSHEAELVVVRDVVISATTDTFAYHTSYQLNDGSNPVLYTLYQETDLIGTDVPTTVQDLTGVVYNSNGTYEIIPRSVNDLADASSSSEECTEAPTLGICTAELLPDRDLEFTATIASAGNTDCRVTQYGFVYSTVNSQPAIGEAQTEQRILGTTIAEDETFSMNLSVLGYNIYYIRAYAVNEVDTAYSEAASIVPAAPETYFVAFNVAGMADYVDTLFYTEGENALTLPAIDDCGEHTFVGWSTTELVTPAHNAPVIYSSYLPTGNTTFYAVFVEGATTDYAQFSVTRDNFGTVAAYGTEDEWIAVADNGNDTLRGYCDLFTYTSAMQMNSSRTGFYNITPIPGSITSISVTTAENSATRNWTPFVANEPMTQANFREVGTTLDTVAIAGESSNAWTLQPESDMTYFYITFTGGAAYALDFTISYANANAIMYTAYPTNDTTVITDVACEGNVYNDWGFHFDQPENGSFTHEEPSVLPYCHTFTTLELTVEEPDTTHEYYSSCESFELAIPNIGSRTYTESANDTIFFSNEENEHGCPSIFIYHIDILQPIHENIIDSACSEYIWNDTTYTESGEYEQTFVAANGCDSIVTLQLTINHGSFTSEEVEVCGNEYEYTFFENAEILSESGIYERYRINEQGCEDTIVLYLSLNQPDTLRINAQICEGETYTQNGFNEAEAGDYVLRLTNQAGCDSIVTLHLTVGGATVNNIESATCVGRNYTDNGFNIEATEAGVFEYDTTIIREGTCDSIVHLTLTVTPALEHTETITLCASELGDFIWNGIAYSELSAVPSVTLTSENGCDSIVFLNLEIIQGEHVTTIIDTCADEFAWWINDSTLYDETFTESTTVDYVAVNSNGCMDTATLILTLNHPTTVTLEASICAGDTYNQNGFSDLVEAGEYRQTLTNAVGCDSTVILNLTVNQPDTIELYETAHDSYSWDTIVLTTTGDYTRNFINAKGCDSTVILHLTIVRNCTITFDINGSTDIVSPISTYEEEVTLPTLTDCNGMRFVGWAAEAVTTLTTDVPEAYTTYTPTANVTLYAVFANEVAQDSIIISRSNFETIAAYGTPDAWSATSSRGAIITGWTDLTSNATFMQMKNTAYPHPYNETELPGDLTEIRIKGAGTGTARSWNAFISSNMLTDENYSDGLDLGQLTPADNASEISWTVSQPSRYFYLKVNSGAVYVDHITVVFNAEDVFYTSIPTQHVELNETVCAGTAYVDEHFNESEAGTYTTTVSEGEYCATIYTLNLTVNQPATTSIEETACGTFTWNGTTYTESGEYTWTGTAANGCDSVVTLVLTVNQPAATSIEETACEAYTWNGTTYTESGEYTWTGTAANGCDSVVTLVLTVNQPAATSIEETACEAYTWNGTTYSESGEYTWTGTTANGCDSVVTLVLTVNQPVATSIEETACETYTWNGTTYSESGEYIWTGTAANGCDSVVTLVLTVNQSSTAEDSVIICASDLPYTWNDVVFTEAGSDTIVMTAGNGCDSILVMTVTVTEINTEILLNIALSTEEYEIIVLQENAEYQWINCTDNTPIEGETGSSFFPTEEGEYACIITLDGCVDTTECEEVLFSGIIENTNTSIKCYPNPANNMLTIDANGIEQVSIFDINGQLISDIRTTRTDSYLLNTQVLAPGTYFVRIHTAEGIASQKVVIVR